MDTVSVDELLLRDNRLFRGGQSLAEQRDALASGLIELDEALPWGGFPRGALTEILHAQDGIGELNWMLPALRMAMAEEPIALINPPYLPYAPALRQAGLDLSRLIWLTPPGDRVLWTAEQCLRAGCLAGVLLWHNGGDERPLRRLQVAAESGRSLAWLFRPAKHAGNPSPAALRIEIERDRLQVLKCRGAVTPVRPIALPVSAAIKALSMPAPQHDELPALEEQPLPCTPARNWKEGISSSSKSAPPPNLPLRAKLERGGAKPAASNSSTQRDAMPLLEEPNPNARRDALPTLDGQPHPQRFSPPPNLPLRALLERGGAKPVPPNSSARPDELPTLEEQTKPQGFSLASPPSPQSQRFSLASPPSPQSQRFSLVSSPFELGSKGEAGRGSALIEKSSPLPTSPSAATQRKGRSYEHPHSHNILPFPAPSVPA